MKRFSIIVKDLKEFLKFLFEDFFTKIHLFIAPLLVISLVEILSLFLIAPNLVKNFKIELIKINPFFLLTIGVLILLFSLWKFLAVVVIKEKGTNVKIKNCIFESLVGVFKTFLPTTLIGGIIAGFLVLFPNLPILFVALLIYFLILFSSYISFEEQRIGFEAMIRGFLILERNIFRFYYQILVFFLFLLLIFYVVAKPFLGIFYFQILPLSPKLNLTLFLIFFLSFYFFFSSLFYFYLSTLFRNYWEIKKYLTPVVPPFSLTILFYLLLGIILFLLIFGINLYE